MGGQSQEIQFDLQPTTLLVDRSPEGDGLRADFFAGMQEVASNVKSALFLKPGDANSGDRQFGQLRLFDSKLGPDPIRSAAEEVVLGGWSQDDLEKLTAERAVYEKEFKWWAAGAGIGIEPPKPGQAMQRLERETAQVISNAQREVEKTFDMDGLKREREEYDQALKRRGMQIGIGIPWPEPGKLMKEYERQVIRRINQQQK